MPKHLQRKNNIFSAKQEGNSVKKQEGICGSWDVHRNLYVPDFNQFICSQRLHLSTVDLQLRVIACGCRQLQIDSPMNHWLSQKFQHFRTEWRNGWKSGVLLRCSCCILIHVQFSTGGGNLYQQQNALNYTTKSMDPIYISNTSLKSKLAWVCVCASLAATLTF